MKKFLTLITAVFTALTVSAQKDALQFCYEDGTIIPDGSVVEANMPDEFMQQFGIYKFNSNVYVKNTLASGVDATLTADIRSIQGDLSLCMGLQCVMYKEKGSYSIPNVQLAAGSINDLQCHWQPAFDEASEKGQAYGKCEADYTISTPEGKCSTITIVFAFEDPSAVQAASAASSRVVANYSTSGRQVSAGYKGLVLRRMADGTLRKVIVR